MNPTGVSAYGVLNVRVRAGLGELLNQDKYSRMNECSDLPGLVNILVKQFTRKRSPKLMKKLTRATWLILIRTHLAEKFP